VRSAFVVADDFDIAAAVGQRLADRGIGHAVAPDRDVQTLIEQLGGRGSLPDAIVYVGTSRLDPSAENAEVDSAFRTVFRLAIEVLARGPQSGVRLLCARVEREGREQPHLVALAGLVKTLAQEHRSCSGVCLALEPEAPATLAARIVDELCAGEDFEVTYRGGLRLTKRMRPFSPQSAPKDYVSADGAYVITGGAGALGLHFAGLLADRGAGEIVLVGRSELDGRTAARVAALGDGRTRVRYARADVARRGEVERLVDSLRRTGGAVRGVIHAAGVIRDARALNKTQAQVDAVLAPKVAGALNLDRATAAEPLDFFVMFSSVVGQTGNRGQSDYAYANAFLDAFAETRERWRAEGRRRGRSLSIGWPLWRDGGMSVDDATAALLERRWGMAPMRTESGLAAFECLLAGTEPAALVVETVGDAIQADEDTPRAALVSVEPPPNATATPPAPAPDIRSTVIERLCGFAADFLLVDAAEVDINTSLLDIGFDSISMTELIARVNESYGLELLPTVLFEYPTLGELAGHIALLHDAAVPTSSSNAPVAQQAPPHELPTRGTLDIAVIGMAGVMPGSADVEEFWRHLAAGDNLVRRVPDDVAVVARAIRDARSEVAAALAHAGGRRAGGGRGHVGRADRSCRSRTGSEPRGSWTASRSRLRAP
jgi:NAD(P)-dependent dehydrogenase (short-subunit alcohol dehydrogenase family)/acyl carrier protein